MCEQKNSVTPVNRIFETEHLMADLKARSVRGGTITMVAQAVKFFLQMGSVVVLARLLTPNDYGLVAMVVAITGFVAMFKDIGLSIATVQKADINHSQVSTLFWINVLIGFGIMVITAAIAPVAAWFYGEQRLIWITLALASGFLFGGLTVQHQALLRRQMRFGRLAAIEIISILVGISIAIVSALYGAGYWALVLMQLAITITTAIGVWVACKWCPGLPVRNSGVRSMLAFGGNLTGFNIVNYFARNLDKILIGWRWGTQSLGLYSRAYSLLMLPLQQINIPISAVAVPTLSRLQNEPQRYRRYYLEAVSIVTLIVLPIVVFTLVMSEEIIELILGPQWHQSAIVFRFLCLSAIAQPICNTSGWLLTSLGRTGRLLKWGVFASVVIVISFFLGLPYGIKGVALFYSFSILLLTVPCISYAISGTSISLRDVFFIVGKNFIASLFAVLPCAVLKFWIGNQIPTLVLVFICVTVTVVIYFLITFYILGVKPYLLVLKYFKKN